MYWNIKFRTLLLINAIIINEKYRNILVIEITIYFATKNLIRLCPLAIAILIVESVYSLEKKMTENIRTISQKKYRNKMWLSLLFLQSMGVLYRYKHEQEIQQFLLFYMFRLNLNLIPQIVADRLWRKFQRLLKIKAKVKYNAFV